MRDWTSSCIRQDEDRASFSTVPRPRHCSSCSTRCFTQTKSGVEGSFAAGVDPDFDDYDFFDIPVLSIPANNQHKDHV
jgi:hypothetical protein